MISWKVKLSLLLTSVVAVFIFLLTATYTTLITYADLFENPHVYQIALVLAITVFGNILFRSAYVYFRLLSISAMAQLLFVEFNYRSAMLYLTQAGLSATTLDSVRISAKRLYE